MVSGGDRRALAAILALAVVVPLMLGAMSGALDVAHNDDFNYRRVALGLYSDGRIELTSWTVMSLVGQLLAVQPLLWLSGGAPWAFAAMTVGFAAVAVVAGYSLVRRVIGTGPATVAMLVLVLFPGFIVNTTSFMTDVPALATAFLCLALGAVAMGAAAPARWRWLAASLVVGCFGISIREFDLAAPLAVVVAVAAADGRNRRTYLVAGLAVLLAFVAIHVATANLPGQGTVVLDTGEGARRLQLAFSTLAFVLAPAIVLAVAAWRDRWWRRDLVPGLIVGIWIASWALSALFSTGRLPGMFVGNIFSDGGTSGSGALAGSRPAIYPAAAWTVVQVIALAATITLPMVASGIIGSTIRSGGFGWTRLRAWLGSPAGLLIAFVAFTAIGLAAFGYAYSMFDRYLWPLAATAAALLLIRPAAMDVTDGARVHEDEAPSLVGAAVVSVAMLTGLAVLSFLLLLNSNAFAAARWQMGMEATARGIPAGSVDAGMEWVGYNATGTARPDTSAQPGAMWYTGWWPSFHSCAIVSSSELRGAGLQVLVADSAAYRQFQLFGPALPLYLYRIAGPGCP